MKIAIAGCGIAGATTGCLLARDGHDVTIFEQTEECQPIGAGIMLQPSGQSVLKELGALHAIETQSARLQGLDAFLLSGRPLIKLRYEALAENTYALGVHRGLLFTQLMDLCLAAGAKVQTSSLISQFESREDGVYVDCDAAPGPFEFLVAADGSRSTLRDVTGIKTSRVDYSYGALWTTGPCAEVSHCLHQVIDGTQRLVGLLPIGNQRCSFFWGLRLRDYQQLRDVGLPAWKQEVLAMCPAATELLESVDDFDQLTLAGYRHARMKSWSADRIVFIGDAAHPSSPHLGQGVNLALEDALCFCTELRDSGDFDSACQRYQRQRFARLRYYQQLTRLLTPFFQSDIPLLSPARNIALPWFPRIPWVRRRMLRTLCGMQSSWLGK